MPESYRTFTFDVFLMFVNNYYEVCMFIQGEKEIIWTVKQFGHRVSVAQGEGIQVIEM